MIERFSHVTLYVLDQEEAKDFYTSKLDFEVRIDFRMDNGFRWLTVSPKGQRDTQIVLLRVDGPHVHAEVSASMKHLLASGHLGTSLVMQTADCRKTCEELAAKGVQIVSPPTSHFHGVEAIIQDNSGNRFTLHEAKGVE